jgi:hypothetical protein
MIQISRSQTSKDLELAKLRKSADQRVNKLIGDTRLNYITDIPGQQIIYANKEQEARDYLSLQTPPNDLAEYPFIDREITATGLSAQAVAQMFSNLAFQWRQVGSALEGLRIGYIQSISQASTKDEIEILLTDLKATLAGL